jgi:tripartite-type tricarboxylate transporter receptor subunit TctC
MHSDCAVERQTFTGAPDVPTAPEQGFKKLESYVWFGLYAPGKTPRAIIAKVNREVGVILKLPETRDAGLQPQ